MLFPLTNTFTVSTLLWIELLLSLQFGNGNALKCYICHGHLSPSLCEATKTEATCGPEDNVCLTFNAIIEEEGVWSIVDRTCGKINDEESKNYKNGCMFSEVEDLQLSACLCTTDLCELTPTLFKGVHASDGGADIIYNGTVNKVSSPTSDNDDEQQEQDKPQVSAILNLLFTIMAFITLLVIIVLSDL